MALGAAKRGVERLRTAAHAASPEGGKAPVDATPFRERFLESMEDDLNTSQALAALFDLAREMNRARDEGRSIQEAQAVLKGLAGVLGLRLAEDEREIAAAPFVELLMELREDLRRAKQFELADSIRRRLSELGVALEDSREGTVWKRKD
jgi:cysteinyl-tRNA synthetase